MNHKANYRYFENSVLQALELPHKGHEASLLAVLPREKDGLPKFEEQWDDELYNLIIKELRSEEVVVNLPKFKIATDVISLKKLLASGPPDGLGAGLAFSNQADFSGIGDEPLKIDEVLHKAFVDVDEKGRKRRRRLLLP